MQASKRQKNWFKVGLLLIGIHLVRQRPARNVSCLVALVFWRLINNADNRTEPGIAGGLRAQFQLAHRPGANQTTLR